MTTALGIFVMLAFVLGITTYLFASRQFEAETQRDEARRQVADLQSQLTAAGQEQEQLRGIIGVEPTMPVADIDTRLTEQFANFPQKEKSFTKLIELLAEAKQSNEQEQLEAVAAKQTALAEEQKDKAAAIAAKKVAEDARQEAENRLTQATQNFDSQWADHEKKQTELLARQRQAEEEARTLRNIRQEILRNREQIAPARRTGFEEKDPLEQLGIVRNELEIQAREITTLNGILARLRVADPDLQKKIAEYRAEDDRIEGFDGRIVGVDSRSNTVLISSPTTTGVRPGLLLYVFSPDDPRPEFGSRKGIVRVARAEGPSRLRATIQEENQRDPILTGDGVASSLWAAGLPPKIVVVGFSDLDRDGRSDRDQLVAMVERVGGQVVAEVTPDTSFVVDLGPPPGGDENPPPEWASEAKREEAAVKTARIMGVQIVGIDRLFDALGIDAGSFKPSRLPPTSRPLRSP